MKKLLIFFFLIVLLRFAYTPLYADGSTGNITISKTVLDPKTETYVKNLGIGDAVYHPGDNIDFHITITNTGSQLIQQLIVKDILPQYINFVSGVGSYDQKNKILSFVVYNLKPNTSQSFAISTQVVQANQFPNNQQELCLANRSTILFGKNQTTQDLAQFCIQTIGKTNPQYSQPTSTQPVYPPATINTSPSTGPSSIILPGLLVSALIGFILIKRTKKSISNA